MKKSVSNIDLESLPSLPLDRREELPELSGVYLAIDGTGGVQYVGQAANIRSRWVVDVTEPVPEPTTILTAAIALGWGGWLKRKNSIKQNKTKSQG